MKYLTDSHSQAALQLVMEGRALELLASPYTPKYVTLLRRSEARLHVIEATLTENVFLCPRADRVTPIYKEKQQQTWPIRWINNYWQRAPALGLGGETPQKFINLVKMLLCHSFSVMTGRSGTCLVQLKHKIPSNSQ